MDVASVGPDGEPLLRPLLGVLLDGDPCFHGGPRGAKGGLAGREAVVSVHETLATIPSYFVDPRRACPATTWYRSVQVRGRLEEIEDAEERAEVLRRLMVRFQPEGGYVPIAPEHPLYRNAIRGLMILRLRSREVVGRIKIGANRSPEERSRILEGLWRRGEPGDVEAVGEVLRLAPGLPTPAFLEAPEGTELLPCPAVHDDAVAGATALLEGQYWNVGCPSSVIAEAHAQADAWIAARDEGGRIVGTARAISDGAKHAWIYGVAVDRAWRGRGLGRAIMELLMDHPRLRRTEWIHLSTKDAQGFYEGLGFGPTDSVCRVPWTRARLSRRRRSA